MNSTYDDPEVRKAYPFADELRETLADSVVRPATPSYADVTLAIQDAIHPPAEVDPKASFNKLQRQPDRSSPTEGCTDGRRR